jgi:hypothetical protein
MRTQYQEADADATTASLGYGRARVRIAVPCCERVRRGIDLRAGPESAAQWEGLYLSERRCRLSFAVALFG